MDTQPLGSYGLLKKYADEARILSIAYAYSESKFRMLNKWLTYPVIILSSLASVFSGLDMDKFILLGLSLSILILSGFNTAIGPLDRSNRANQFKTEFDNISSDIGQFINENNKTKDEIKAYSAQCHELLNVWKSLSPPVQSSFVKQASIEVLASRKSISKKKDSPV